MIICHETLEPRIFLSLAPAAPATADPADPPALHAAASASRALARPIIIDHTSVAVAGKLSQATMNLIASRLSFFFAHASVGGNIVGGINALHASSPARYKITSASEDATPPAVAAKGTLYEYGRGNPSWQQKVDNFKAYLANGWGNRVNVVINKFCYIDPNASFKYYAVSNARGTAMSQLEAKYRKTKFVYMTIPLTADDGADNITRNDFNNSLRRWARANNKILLDIADIEAWTPRSAQTTFTSDGKRYQRLYSGYTSDGGHLNALGAKRVALAFYTMAAKLV